LIIFCLELIIGCSSPINNHSTVVSDKINTEPFSDNDNSNHLVFKYVVVDSLVIEYLDNIALVRNLSDSLSKIEVYVLSDSFITVDSSSGIEKINGIISISGSITQESVTVLNKLNLSSTFDSLKIIIPRLPN